MTLTFAARAVSVLVVVARWVGSDVAIAQTEADRAEALGRGLDGSFETSRFAVFWSTEEASSDQLSPCKSV